MFILIILATVLLVGIVVVVILASSKLDIFRVQRTAMIQADPAIVFPYINDFHNRAAWSPFERLDPNMKKTFSGAANGCGAVYEWSGNSKAGVGRIEITESSPPGQLIMQLSFLKPFKSQNTAEFTLLAKGASTEITWAMLGKSPFVAKVFQVFCNMDRMLGKDFETGLANLKQLAEAQPVQ